jgi:hypothetical protein
VVDASLRCMATQHKWRVYEGCVSIMKHTVWSGTMRGEGCVRCSCHPTPHDTVCRSRCKRVRGCRGGWMVVVVGGGSLGGAAGCGLGRCHPAWRQQACGGTEASEVGGVLLMVGGLSSGTDRPMSWQKGNIHQGRSVSLTVPPSARSATPHTLHRSRHTTTPQHIATRVLPRCCIKARRGGLDQVTITLVAHGMP